MQKTSFPDPQQQESFTVQRDDADGCITLSLRIAPEVPPDFDDALTLLTSWWLRWIAAVDCNFDFVGDAWLVHCRFPPYAHRLLVQILRDLSAIKNVICV